MTSWWEENESTGKQLKGQVYAITCMELVTSTVTVVAYNARTSQLVRCTATARRHLYRYAESHTLVIRTLVQKQVTYWRNVYRRIEIYCSCLIAYACHVSKYVCINVLIYIYMCVYIVGMMQMGNIIPKTGFEPTILTIPGLESYKLGYLGFAISFSMPFLFMLLVDWLSGGQCRHLLFIN